MASGIKNASEDVAKEEVAPIEEVTEKTEETITTPKEESVIEPEIQSESAPSGNEATDEIATTTTTDEEQSAPEEKPAVGTEAIVQNLKKDDDLSDIKPLDNITSDAASAKNINTSSPSTLNTILIVLIILSALVLAASIIAFFFVA